MKAVILAAGKGSRIHTVSDGKPKSLLPLADTTLLGHSLRSFWAQGIKEIVVVTGYKRSEIMSFVSEEWPGQCEFVYNPHYETTNVLYSFWLALPYLKGSDFFFLHADTVFAPEILSRLQQYSGDAGIVFAVDEHPCEEEEMKVKVADGKVTLVTKQMPSDEAFGEFLGLARITGEHIPSIRHHAEKLFEAGSFQSFFEHAIQNMIDEGAAEVSVLEVTGLPWREVDFPEDYEAALNLLS